MIERPHLCRTVAAAATTATTATGGSGLFDGAEIPNHATYDPGFLPGFAHSGVRRGTLVCLPPAFRKYPAVTFCGLDDEDSGAVRGEWNDACNKAFSLVAIAWKSGEETFSNFSWQVMPEDENLFQKR
jgi:hypothetical protein